MQFIKTNLKKNEAKNQTDIFNFNFSCKVTVAPETFKNEGAFIQTLDFTSEPCSGLTKSICNLFSSNSRDLIKHSSSPGQPNFYILFADSDVVLIYTCYNCQKTLEKEKYELAYVLARSPSFSKAKVKIIGHKLRSNGINFKLFDVLRSNYCLNI